MLPKMTCFFDGDPCEICLPEICPDCRRFNAFHAEKLPRLGKIERALLVEGSADYGKDFRFPALTESQSASRRRAMAKLEKSGFLRRKIHTAKRSLSFWDGGWRDVSRCIPALTPLGAFVVQNVLAKDRPIRWDLFRSQIRELGFDAERMRLEAISYCQRQLKKSYEKLALFSKYNIKDSVKSETEKIKFFSDKLESLGSTKTQNVTPSKKIDEPPPPVTKLATPS